MGLGGDVGDDGSAVVGIRNRTGAGSALRGDVGNNKSVVVDDRLAVRNDGSAVGDDGSAIDNDGLATGINKRMNMDDGSNT